MLAYRMLNREEEGSHLEGWGRCVVGGNGSVRHVDLYLEGRLS